MKDKNIKILIAGRTGSGKDTVAKIFEDKGYKILKSYTTRPKRFPEEDTHIFIDKNDIGLYKTDVIAYSKIGEFEYFSTLKQFKEADVYIVDPNGIDELIHKKEIHNIRFVILYIKAYDPYRFHRAATRGSNRIIEFFVTLKRNKKENRQFSKFEKRAFKDFDLLDNSSVISVKEIHNNGSIKNLKKSVNKIIDSIENKKG